MDQKKGIGNVNVLDIRKASAEAIAAIGTIDNANVVIYSAETAGYVSKIHFNNVNATFELPEDVQLSPEVGRLALQKAYFENLASPTFPIVIGQCLIDGDVTVEAIEKGLSGLVIVGQVVCPEPLAGAIQAKMRYKIGETKTYPVLKHVRSDSLVLDLDSLQALEDKSELTVLGGLSMLEVLPSDLLQKKIQKLFVLDGIRCHAENAAFLKAHLLDGSGKVTVIPAGFEWVVQPLSIDDTLLEAVKGKSLYCGERIQIEPEVAASVLEKNLEGIASDDVILCPAHLKTVLVKKCDLLKNRVVFYEGNLMVIDDEYNLGQPYLEAQSGKFTLFVTGELTIDPAVDPKVLVEKLAKVHNLGEIRCTPAQMGVIQARLGLHEGDLVDSTQVKEALEPDTSQIDNANYLVL